MLNRALMGTLLGIGILAILLFVCAGLLPSLAAGGLLHPARHHVNQGPPAGCEEATFPGFGVTLKGWRCRAPGEVRGTLVYLHGVADNRTSAAGVVKRFTSRGLDVVAYDSRAHGESGGDTCTYGHFEKEDLRRVLDRIERRPIVLLGTSLGAAVALQEAAADPRVVGVVAAEVFSDLRTVARERAPFILTGPIVKKAFVLAEVWGRFAVDDVSPMRAAEHIHVPVLLIHGAQDRDTTPDHSRRVFAALAGPKRLVIVEGARHNESLSRESVWLEIERWLADLLSRHANPG